MGIEWKGGKDHRLFLVQHGRWDCRHAFYNHCFRFKSPLFKSKRHISFLHIDICAHESILRAKHVTPGSQVTKTAGMEATAGGGRGAGGVSMF